MPNLNILRGAPARDVVEERVEGVDVGAGAGREGGVFAEEGGGEGGLCDCELGGGHLFGAACAEWRDGCADVRFLGSEVRIKVSLSMSAGFWDVVGDWELGSSDTESFGGMGCRDAGILRVFR